MSGFIIDRTENGPIYHSDLRDKTFSRLKAEYDRENSTFVPRPAASMVLMSIRDLGEVLDHVFKAYNALFGERVYPEEMKSLIIEHCYLGYEKRVLELRDKSILENTNGRDQQREP